MATLWIVDEPYIPDKGDQKQIASTGTFDGELNQLIVCCICYDVYEEPKALSCLHRFCEKCIHGYILGSRVQTSNLLFQRQGFKCPVCRQFINAPDSRKPPLKWASLLKTDFHLKSLIKLVQSNKIPTFSKTEDDKNACEKLHGVTKRTVYCAECRNVICPMCAQAYHKECSIVVPLKEAATDRRARAAMWLEEVSPKLEEATNLEKLREKRHDELHQQKAAIRLAINRRADEIRQLVQQEEDRLLEKLDQEVDVHQNRAALEAIIFNDKLTSYKEKYTSVSSFLQIGSDLQLMTKNSFADSVDPSEKIDLMSYERFVNSLSSVKITFQQAQTPSVSLGDVELTFNIEIIVI